MNPPQIEFRVLGEWEQGRGQANEDADEFTGMF